MEPDAALETAIVPGRRRSVGHVVSRTVLLAAAVAAGAICGAGTLGMARPASGASAAPVCGPVETRPLPEAPWALARLRPDLAWPLSRGAGVTVAVIDSGVSDDHPSLAGAVLPGLDLAGGGWTAGGGRCDENGHGTLVAGLIAGRETVSAGYRFSGIAPDATILPVRVLRDQRLSYQTDLSTRIATAVTWAVDHGADVVNLSLTTTPSPELAGAVAHALRSGVVVVAAAGNEGTTGRVGYPAAYDGVIAVAGVDAQDQHVPSSSVGEHVDLAAPGTRISGPAAGGGGYLFAEQGGTSFAAAYVSGVTALVRAYEPALTPAQVVERLTRTADHPPGSWTPEVGHGVVNPARAVGALSLASASGVPSGSLPSRPPAAGARDAVATAAPWVAAGAATVTVCLIVAVPVARRGRQRRWRPGH